MNHKCSECETDYIPYSNEIPCPKCGDKVKMKDYPELIDGICESFLYNINNFESFVPICWAAIDISDSLQMFLFGLFRNWMKEAEDHEPQTRTKAFEEFLNKVNKIVDLGDRDYMLDYLKTLAMDVYEEFFNARGVNLEIANEKIKVVK